MKITLQLAATKSQEENLEKVSNVLKKNGFETIRINKEIDPNLVALVFLGVEITPEMLFSAFPWLKEEYARSSCKYLRLMPFIAYHPKKENIDDLWENGIGETYEEVFSGEFKPYGWDLDDEETIKEFLRVYEEGYLE